MPCLEMNVPALPHPVPSTRLRALLEKPGAAVLRRNELAEAPGHEDRELRNRIRVAAVLAVNLTDLRSRSTRQARRMRMSLGKNLMRPQTIRRPTTRRVVLPRGWRSGRAMASARSAPWPMPTRFQGRWRCLTRGCGWRASRRRSSAWTSGWSGCSTDSAKDSPSPSRAIPAKLSRRQRRSSTTWRRSGDRRFSRTALHGPVIGIGRGVPARPAPLGVRLA